MSTGKVFLQSAIQRLIYYKTLGEQAFAQIEETDFHFRPNEESNSIAVIIQHLYGNMLSRWTDFLTTDGEKEWRNRDTEFELRNLSKQELTGLWDKGWTCLIDTLNSLHEDDLTKIIHIRKEPLIVIDAINRQLAHYPYHIGQIIYIAKMIQDSSWKNLSIEKKRSDDFNNEMAHRFKSN